MSKSKVPKDVRKRFYYVIVMPCDIETGYGPSNPETELSKLSWEIWDQFLTSYASYDYLPDAIQKCEELNYSYHVNGIDPYD